MKLADQEASKPKSKKIDPVYEEVEPKLKDHTIPYSEVQAFFKTVTRFWMILRINN